MSSTDETQVLQVEDAGCNHIDANNLTTMDSLATSNNLVSEENDVEPLDNRPVAGSTMQEHTEEVSDSRAPQHTWERCAADVFNLRVGPNYERNKMKGPSPSAFYELVGVDLVGSDTRITDFGSRVKLPQHWTDRQTGIDRVPALFIINFQVPTESTYSVFREITDGPGYCLVLYFLMTEETVQLLQNESSVPLSGPLKLLVQYLRGGPEADADPRRSPWRGRFKVMVHCRDIESFKLPSFITSYNAKPVLIRQTGDLIRGSSGLYVEMDVNVHRFGNVPKQALGVLRDRFHIMDIFMGFCVESREDAEMPETLIGCAALNRPVYSTAPMWTP